MKTIKLFIAAVLLALAATSCLDDVIIEGNGIIANEGRMVSSFRKVSSEGPFVVHITEGNETEVIVSADENLIQYVETFVRNKTLQIEVKGIRTLRSDEPIEVFVTTPVLRGISQSGSGIVSTSYFRSNEMDIKVSGSGTIKAACEAEDVFVAISGSGLVKLSGFADDGDYTISGSGTIDARHFDLLNCITTTSGSGDIYVSVEDRLNSLISGSGDVFVYGDATVDSSISGTGRIIYR